MCQSCWAQVLWPLMPRKCKTSCMKRLFVSRWICIRVRQVDRLGVVIYPMIMCTLTLCIGQKVKFMEHVIVIKIGGVSSQHLSQEFIQQIKQWKAENKQVVIV